MAKSYKPRRVKLKRHDAGNDRHNKTVNFDRKLGRRELQHAQQTSRKGLKKL